MNSAEGACRSFRLRRMAQETTPNKSRPPRMLPATAPATFTLGDELVEAVVVASGEDAPPSNVGKVFRMVEEANVADVPLLVGVMALSLEAAVVFILSLLSSLCFLSSPSY